MPRVFLRGAGRRRVVALALLLGLSGCSAGDSESRASDARTTASVPSAESAAAQPIDPWTLPLPVVGQPVAAGDVAAVYTASAGMLSLVGVDARTGAQLWTHPASPAYVVPGIATTPTVVHDVGC